MIEMMNGLIKWGRVTIPEETGPGPIELIGYYERPNGSGNSGYYGTIDSTEFINGSDLASLVSLTGGSLINNETQWFKFLLDGEILFTPVKQIRHSISWDMLNGLNLVYGNKVIGINGYNFEISLFKGFRTDPTLYSGGNNAVETIGSQWSRLIHNVWDGKLWNGAVVPSYVQEGDKWGNFSISDLGYLMNGSYNLLQETNSADSTKRFCIPPQAPSQRANVAASLENANVGWRPVLKLIPSL